MFSATSAASGRAFLRRRSSCLQVLEVLVRDPGLYVAEIGVQLLALLLCLDGKAGDDRARHLARDGDEVILLRLDAAHHVVHEFVFHVVVAQGIEFDGVVGVDGGEEHHLLQPSRFRGRLDHLREEIDVSFRVDDGEVVALPDVLLDDGLHEPRLADAGGPEAAQVTASLRVRYSDEDVPGPVGEVHPLAENRDPAVRPAFSLPVYLAQSFEAVSLDHGGLAPSRVLLCGALLANGDSGVTKPQNRRQRSNTLPTRRRTDGEMPRATRRNTLRVEGRAYPLAAMSCGA